MARGTVIRPPVGMFACIHRLRLLPRFVNAASSCWPVTGARVSPGVSGSGIDVDN
ncbi:hypothetical protein STRIP9103_07692 [Streptomyces ipomoeae 91-03]|uniref:Uncharacterized protein n=1 Tax=Streptomyces ipomoeae 91-03 TaxID=698759 RepID=L1KV95_9ACTN|nr:hypothetical protein STRIP9103_07692 [Streptomyces ipomoeae 91-03]